MAHARTMFLAAVAALAAGWALAAEEPENPLRRDEQGSDDFRPGWLALSDKAVHEGAIRTTRGKPLTVFDRKEKKYRRIEWKDVARIDVAIERDVLEQDWRWKESGSDVKVYTDLWYAWYKHITTVTLKDGTSCAGDLAAPIYVKKPGQDDKLSLILHKRDKGEKAPKDEVKPPIYIVKIILTDIEGAEKPPPPPETEKPPAESKAEGDQPAAEQKDAGQPKDDQSSGKPQEGEASKTDDGRKDAGQQEQEGKKDE